MQSSNFGYFNTRIYIASAEAKVNAQNTEVASFSSAFLLKVTGKRKATISLYCPVPISVLTAQLKPFNTQHHLLRSTAQFT